MLFAIQFKFIGVIVSRIQNNQVPITHTLHIFKIRVIVYNIHVVNCLNKQELHCNNTCMSERVTSTPCILLQGRIQLFFKRSALVLPCLLYACIMYVHSVTVTLSILFCTFRRADKTVSRRRLY